MVILTCMNVVCGNEPSPGSADAADQVESATAGNDQTAPSAESLTAKSFEQHSKQVSNNTAVSKAAAQQDTYLDDLQQLLTRQSCWIYPKNLSEISHRQTVEMANGGENYLSDLQNLLQQHTDSSPRLAKTRPPVPESHPAESVAVVPEVLDTYRSDLKNLLQQDDSPSPQSGVTPARLAGLQAAVSESEAEVAEVDVAAEKRDAKENQTAFDELNTPLDELLVTGNSSSPPEDLPTEKPASKASLLIENGPIPICYQTTGYGVRRAPRNTLRFFHNPLYFEDSNLERCGRSHGCLTTAGSAIHFAAKIFMAPYLTAVHHPTDCVVALPDCPTCHEFSCDAYWPGWSWKGAAVQGAAVTGMIYVIP